MALRKAKIKKRSCFEASEAKKESGLKKHSNFEKEKLEIKSQIKGTKNSNFTPRKSAPIS